MKLLEVVDSHTGGEPTRVVVAGGPDLGGGPMSERLERLRAGHDWLRRAVVNEPRGSDVLVGALLCEPRDPRALAGAVFFNNVGYLGMCGHGTMGLVVTLAHLGRATPGEHLVETPAGTVAARLHDDGRVSVANVRSYRALRGVSVSFEVPGGGSRTVTGDVAYGGNWFFLCHDHGLDVEPGNVPALTEAARRIKAALAAAGVTGEGHEVDHVELFGPSDVADSRSFVLCPGDAYDRSPCGTGTSAKLACLAADGLLAPGVVWRQESVIGSVFEAAYAPAAEGGVLPTVTGTAHVTAEATLLLDPSDPYVHGIPGAAGGRP